MPNMAFTIGGDISVGHMAHAKAATGCDPRPLNLYNGSPTTDPSKLGSGKGTLYVCGHGSADELAGYTPNALLTELFIKGLDRSKFDTVFLFSCSTAQGGAGYDGRTFAQNFYDACQRNAVFKGMVVKGYTGALHYDIEPGGMNRAPIITGECVILPSGSKVSVASALVELSSRNQYVPPVGLL